MDKRKNATFMSYFDVAPCHRGTTPGVVPPPQKSLISHNLFSAPSNDLKGGPAVHGRGRPESPTGVAGRDGTDGGQGGA